MKIVRVVNVLAVIGLLGAAAIAYRVKYDATLHAEEVAKLRRQIDRERDGIAVLQAEIARRMRPDRIQALTERHLDYGPFTTKKLVSPADLPVKPAPVDLIAQKLEMLGLGDLPNPAVAPAKGSAPRKSIPQ